MEKDFPGKWNLKASKNSYTHMGKSILQTNIRRARVWLKQ
jgi:hypothetical protein